MDWTHFRAVGAWILVERISLIEAGVAPNCPFGLFRVVNVGERSSARSLGVKAGAVVVLDDANLDVDVDPPDGLDAEWDADPETDFGAPRGDAEAVPMSADAREWLDNSDRLISCKASHIVAVYEPPVARP